MHSHPLWHFPHFSKHTTSEIRWQWKSSMFWMCFYFIGKAAPSLTGSSFQNDPHPTCFFVVFHSKIKSLTKKSQIRNVLFWMSGFVRVPTGKWLSRIPRSNLKNKVCEFARVSRENKICSLNLKGWSSNTSANSSVLKPTLPQTACHSSGAVWESRWPSWAICPNEPSGFRGRKAI